VAGGTSLAPSPVCGRTGGGQETDGDAGFGASPRSGASAGALAARRGHRRDARRQRGARSGLTVKRGGGSPGYAVARVQGARRGQVGRVTGVRRAPGAGRRAGRPGWQVRGISSPNSPTSGSFLVTDAPLPGMLVPVGVLSTPIRTPGRPEPAVCPAYAGHSVSAPIQAMQASSAVSGDVSATCRTGRHSGSRFHSATACSLTCSSTRVSDHGPVFVSPSLPNPTHFPARRRGSGFSSSISWIAPV
jgi:hypothetical protein